MKFINHKTIIIFLILSLIISKLTAQNEAANWVMWPSKFNFNTVPPSSSNQLNDTIIQSSSISDKNGNLLLYTNGFNVWNKNFQKIEGNLSNYKDINFAAQGPYNCLIVPSPADSNQFYIFGTWINKDNNGKGLRLQCYSIIDIHLNGGIGKVISSQNIIDTNLTFYIAATKHCNNRDYWIVTYRNNSKTFLSILLTKDGVSKTLVESKISEKPKVGLSPNWSKFKISPNGKFISIIGKDALYKKEQLETFLFNNQNGEITTRILNYTDTLIQYNYGGLEFSPDNSKLYFGNTKSEIFQFDLSIIDSNIINASRTKIVTVEKGQSSRMQLAPNNKIYVNGSIKDCIEKPNKKDCKYTHQVISIYDYVNFPTLISSYLNQPAEIEKFCYKDSTTFKVLNAYTYDSIRWDFGDLASNKNYSNDTLAYHIYSNYGLFKGVLHMFKCGSESVYNFKVSISKPAKITFNILKPICINDKPFKLKHALPDSGIYTLNNLEIDSIVPNNIGVGKHLLKYQIENDSGCVSVDSLAIEIKPLPIAKIISSRSPLLCLGDSVIFTTSFSKNYWSTSDSSKSIIVKKAGLFYVSVVDTFGCKNNSDTIKVELKDIPVAKIIASDTLICEGNEFILTATGDGDYKWSNGKISKQIFIKANNSETYKLTVTNYCGNDEDTIKVTVLRTNAKAYPNPVRNKLQVDLSECGGTKQLVELFDESGKLILQFETENKSEKIDMSHFAEGNYLLRVGSNKYSQVFKVQFVN
jgi:hypothetical protein